MMKKVASVFKDFRTIYLGVAILVSAASWAGNATFVQKADGPFMKKSYGETLVAKINLTNFQDGLEALETELAIIKNPERRKVLESLIRLKERKINGLLESQQLR